MQLRDGNSIAREIARDGQLPRQFGERSQRGQQHIKALALNHRPNRE